MIFEEIKKDVKDTQNKFEKNSGSIKEAEKDADESYWTSKRRCGFWIIDSKRCI